MSCYDEERNEKTKEQKRLEKMSIEQLREELDARMRGTLIAEIEKLPQRIDAHLDAAAWNIICAAMGIKKGHWHDDTWEIDDHHSKTAMALALGEHALKQITLAIPDFIEGLVVGDPRIPPIKTAYTKAYKQKLAELVNTKLWEVAQRNAEKRFVEIMEQVSSGQKVDIQLSDDDEDTDEEETDVNPEP